MTGTVDVADVIDSHKVSRYRCLIAFMACLTLPKMSGDLMRPNTSVLLFRFS
jgi:hypothetical protein